MSHKATCLRYRSHEILFVRARQRALWLEILKHNGGMHITMVRKTSKICGQITHFLLEDFRSERKVYSSKK